MHDAGVAAECRRQCRQQHQCQHHREVFDDQPANGDLAVRGLQRVAFFEGAQQHHGAGYRQRQAEYQAAAQAPAEHVRHAETDGSGRENLCNGSGQCDVTHRQQILDREMQTDAEHQQDHANLGELPGESSIADESRREGADRDARQQVADDRRNAHQIGHQAEEQRQHKADG